MAVLSITSQVALARVGHAVQAPVFQRLRIPYWAVPTVTLATHGGETRPGGGPLGADVLGDLLAAAVENPRFRRCEAVMSGYLGRDGAVPAVLAAVDAAKARAPAVRYFCDPVIGDDDMSGGPGRSGLYVPESLAEAIRDRLVPVADVVFPNRFEAAWLSGRTIETPDDAEAAARDLLDRGAGACVVTGVPAPGDRLASVLVGPEGVAVASNPRVESRAKGAGDLFCALFVGHTLAGEPPGRALEWASTGAGRALAFARDDGLDDLPVVESIEAIVDVEGPFGSTGPF